MSLHRLLLQPSRGLTEFYSLGRLTVEVSSESVSVKTQNVAAFSIKWSTSFFDTFIIDDSEVNVDFAGEGTQLSFVYNSHRWQVRIFMAHLKRFLRSG